MQEEYILKQETLQKALQEKGNQDGHNPHERSQLEEVEHMRDSHQNKGGSDNRKK